jgi:hypothetical protein
MQEHICAHVFLTSALSPSQLVARLSHVVISAVSSCLLMLWCRQSIALLLLLLLQVSAALPNRADVLLLMGAICYQLKDYQQCIAYNDRYGLPFLNRITRMWVRSLSRRHKHDHTLVSLAQLQLSSRHSLVTWCGRLSITPRQRLLLMLSSCPSCCWRTTSYAV